MDRPVTVHEMESMAIGLDGPDFTKEIGIIPDNDALGFGMLANPGRQRGGNTFTLPESSSAPASSGLAEVEIGSLDTLEPITLNLGSSSGSAQPVEIQFTKAENDIGSGGLFSNMQTSTAPGFNLASAPTPRMDPEKERKEKSELVAKLQRLDQKGFPVSKRFTMDNSLE